MQNCYTKLINGKTLELLCEGLKYKASAEHFKEIYKKRGWHNVAIVEEYGLYSIYGE